MRAPVLLAALSLLTLVTSLGSPLAAQGPTGEEIRARVEILRSTGRLEAAGERLVFPEPVAEVYEVGGYRPLWSQVALQQLMAGLEAMAADGLDPDHYHLSALRSGSATWTSPLAAAELDLLATDALVSARHDLRFGRVPLEVRGAAASQIPSQDPAEILDIVRSAGVEASLREARPHHWIYRGLVAALADLRRIEAAGGWGSIPEGPTLRPDSLDERVPALRRRLILGGDMDPEAAARGTLFDPELEISVRAFQHRHGLNEDGLVGKATLEELNVPVSTRIQQVRANLERARWVIHDLPRSFLAVNVAGARVYLVRDSLVAFETRAVVGKTYTKTPTFRASLRYVELNPTWTVPPGIVGEVLSQVRQDPDYLAKQHMRVLDASGRTLDPSGIDFSGYSSRSFPYVFRQDPGPLNALGEVKFVLPNSYNVYLHDTPSRELFQQEQRTFSHGCIRVQYPLTLAEMVLDDTVHWTRDSLEDAVALGTTQTIDLREPLPVLILYWTASTDLHGELHFYRDVYGRDPAVLEALDGR